MHGARHPSLTGRRWVSSTVPPVPQDADATGDNEEEEDDDDDDDDDDMDGVFDDEEGRGVYAHNTTYRFMDRARIEVRGGRGGSGCVSYQVLAPGKKRPNGGNGGAGGDVYIVADRGLNGMSFQTFHFNAGNGKNGGSDGLTGRRGEDMIIRVPMGTIVSERLPDGLMDFLEEEPEAAEGLELRSVDLDVPTPRCWWRKVAPPGWATKTWRGPARGGGGRSRRPRSRASSGRSGRSCWSSS